MAVLLVCQVGRQEDAGDETVSDVFANYDAAAWAEAIDTVAPSGIIITSASAQSKDLAARIAA